MTFQTLTEYDQLLAEAVRLRQGHEMRAKDFVPKMYDALVREGLAPEDATDRISKDVVSIWERDTIRRLSPEEAKNQSASERQSRLHMASDAGSILQNERSSKEVALLQKKNAALVQKVEALQMERKELLERAMSLERMLLVHRELGNDSHPDDKHHFGRSRNDAKFAVVMPPHLFMKAFTLMRNSTRPLILKVSSDEVVDVDRIGNA